MTDLMTTPTGRETTGAPGSARGVVPASAVPTREAAPLPTQSGPAMPGSVPFQGYPPNTPPPGYPYQPVAGPPRPPRRRRRAFAAVGLAIVLAGSGVGGVAVGAHLNQSSAPAGSVVAGSVSATTGELTLAQVAAAVSPSVVTVEVSSGNSGATGSGVILSADGLIVTNNHVVASTGRRSSTSVKVVFSDGSSATATIVGTDPSADLAVLQATGVSGLTPATLGSDSDLAVGDTVLAFGSPLGLDGTVTAGIVSALDRSLTESGSSVSLSGLVQTDAPLNPGNSGGALVDASGRVVGINVAIATADDSSSGNIGVGFAIPIDSARTVISRLTASAS